jgi:pyruvate dehydrogenase E2 component (dihydrolipoamide acetyltransferase)
MDIKIPFLGDGIDAANVVGILVSVGDVVVIDQTLIELETDKATAPVPATAAGTVSAILVSDGDVVKEGMAVVRLEGAGAPAANTPASNAASVGSAPAPVPAKGPAAPTPVVPVALPTTAYAPVASADSVPASPAIKRFALLSGLDLGRIPGSGQGGRVTWSDVQAYMAHVQATAFQSATQEAPSPAPSRPRKPVVDFGAFGPIRKQPLTSLRQKIANHLSSAWQDIPHVTQFGDTCMDPIMTLRRSVNAGLSSTDIPVSVTVFVLKALAKTLEDFPQFNASLVANELVIKEYIHLGVAVDTEAGLVVPVIRDVNKKSLQEIARTLDELAEKARSKSLAVPDIQGATFTLSNLGGLGASYFTPIVNAPEVAILGAGRARHVVSYDDKTGTCSNRLMMPVALSYDHRVIDGADGARFMQALTNRIESFDVEWV